MRWVPLSGELDMLKFRKALTAMSVGGMTIRQLRAATGLKQREVTLLLRALTTAEALEIEAAVKTPALGRLKLTAHCDIDLPLEPGIKSWAALATPRSV
jgi:hypothetical protein